MESQKQIGKNLKEARNKIGLTQAQVAEKVGVHPNWYARLEQGREKARLETYEKIFGVLKVKSSDILPF